VNDAPGFFAGDIMHAGLLKEQPGMLAAQADERRHHLLLAEQANAVIDADGHGLAIVMDSPGGAVKIAHGQHLWE